MGSTDLEVDNMMTASTKELIFEVIEKHGWDKELQERFAVNYDAEAHRIEFAKRLLKRNRLIEEIIEDTELTREKIESLR